MAHGLGFRFRGRCPPRNFVLRAWSVGDGVTDLIGGGMFNDSNLET